MEDVRKIKGLNTQIKTLKSDAELLLIDIKNKQREHEAKKAMIRNLEEKIKELSSGNNDKIKVSEHAILRYLERVKGINISDIEKEIVNSDIIKMVDVVGGSGTYPNKDFTVVMKNKTVTTIK